MNRNILLIGAAYVILLLTGCGRHSDWPVLAGPYLGQEPPGSVPEVFAPGIISTAGRYELNAVFSPAGDEFYFEISTTTPEEKAEGSFFYLVMVSRLDNGVWTLPDVPSFAGEFSTMDMCFSADGNRLYFSSERPAPGESSSKVHIWFVERIGDGWSDPEIIAPPIYSSDCEQGQPALANDGTLYFRRNPYGTFDLYSSRYEGGRYVEPVRLGDAINTPYDEGKPFIDPAGEYLLFIRYGMPDSIDGGGGLYICCRGEDGDWMPARNTNISGSLPKCTPDGKYFFFSRGGDIYWVSIDTIDALKSGQ